MLRCRRVRCSNDSPTYPRCWLAVSEFSEDPTGAFILQTHRDANIVVFDRNTLAKTVRDLPSKQAFPMLGSASRLGYLDRVP